MFPTGPHLLNLFSDSSFFHSVFFLSFGLLSGRDLQLDGHPLSTNEEVLRVGMGMAECILRMVRAKHISLEVVFPVGRTRRTKKDEEGGGGGEKEKKQEAKKVKRRVRRKSKKEEEQNFEGIDGPGVKSNVKTSVLCFV